MVKNLFSALLLALTLVVPIGFSHAAFNSWIASSPHYRPVFSERTMSGNFEMYVDLTSISTIQNDDKTWKFNVIMFTSPEDSGIIKNYGSATTFMVKKKSNKAYVYYTPKKEWIEIPVNGERVPRHLGAYFATINYCYAYMFGHYLSPANKMSGWESYYKG